LKFDRKWINGDKCGKVEGKVRNAIVSDVWKHYVQYN